MQQYILLKSLGHFLTKKYNINKINLSFYYQIYRNTNSSKGSYLNQYKVSNSENTWKVGFKDRRETVI